MLTSMNHPEIAVVTVNSDPKISTAKEAMHKYAIGGPHIHDPMNLLAREKAGRLGKSWGASGISDAFVLDADGKVIYKNLPINKVGEALESVRKEARMDQLSADEKLQIAKDRRKRAELKQNYRKSPELDQFHPQFAESEELMREGMKHYSQAQYRLAIESFKKVQKIFPTHSMAKSMIESCQSNLSSR